MATKPRYIMVGGFLGAGKTTALLRLAERFRDRGQRVGFITNDQSVGLVDTALLAAHDFAVEEITGGCFCCKFASLTEAAEKLTEAEKPDVFLAEPVGSCTDLTATVSYPLRRLYGDNFSLSPFSVLIDPVRAERILGLASGKSFSPKVIYIYKKQLEEADVIVVNKIDTLDESRTTRLLSKLAAEYPKAKVVTLSARHGTNLDAWAELIEAVDLPTGTAMDIDYDTYAEGEALLGWLNLTANVSAHGPFDGNRFLGAFFTQLHGTLREHGFEIAHLKATLSPYEGADIAVTNLVRTDATAESSHELADDIEAGELIVNLRAEADPEMLKSLVLAVLNENAGLLNVAVDVEHAEAFRPGRPAPTHRDAH